MRQAWIQAGNAALQVSLGADNSATAADGRTWREDQATWLPPPRGTVLALGLNYAAPGAAPPREPLLFLKTPNAFVGHRQFSYRPDHVEHMRCEAELAVVIGATARRATRRDAMEYVGGYTLCNDYAVRDCLENYYRPNLAVKCRDALTPLGPAVVSRDEVGDPHRLRLAAWVNGELRLEGNTRDMIFDIPFLIEYLSAFMTLRRGDMILTGTPSGNGLVRPGDEVTIEVERVGRLINYVVSEQEYRAHRQSHEPTT